MNTRKDFIRAASLVSDLPEEDKNKAVGLFIRFFQEDNPRFDARKFVAECNADYEYKY